MCVVVVVQCRKHLWEANEAQCVCVFTDGYISQKRSTAVCTTFEAPLRLEPVPAAPEAGCTLSRRVNTWWQTRAVQGLWATCRKVCGLSPSCKFRVLPVVLLTKRCQIHGTPSGPGGDNVRPGPFVTSQMCVSLTRKCLFRRRTFDHFRGCI